MPVLLDHTNRGYSRHFRAAKEPSLYLASLKAARSGRRIVRFTWLRSFHPPVFVRIEWDNQGKARLIAKQMSGAGGYDPGVIAKRLDRPLSGNSAHQIESVIEQTRLFDLPPQECSPYFHVDGADWTVEGVDSRGYHFVIRGSPRNGVVRRIGDMMLRVTGWKFDPIY